MFEILTLPSPLHPAVVHFPIALIILGSAVAVVAAFSRRWHLPGIAAALFVLGAVGSVVAAQAGEREGELAGGTPAIETILDRHENWAGRTQFAAILVAVLAVGAAVTSRWPTAARALSVATAAGALAAALCVAETGHYGGQLVFRHGTGVNLAPAEANAVAKGQAASENKVRRTRDDD